MISVSVLCLAYNHEKYIEKTIQGLISQKTSFEVEFLIHDDCSTDHTRDIIDKYVALYPNKIIPIYETENMYSKGVEFINDILLPVANGKYIAFCECDDYWNDSDKLQKQFDIMENNPECSMCVHKVACCNEDGSKNNRLIPEDKYGLEHDQFISQDEFAKLLYLRGGYPFHTSSYFIKKEILEDNIKLSRDQGVMRKALYHGGVYYIDRPMSVRRLWSIGNYNSRLKAGGDKAKIQVLLSDLEDEIKFDLYTKGMFAKYITQLNALRILGIAKCDLNLGHSIVKNYWEKLDSSKCKCLRFRTKIEVYLLMHMPKLYNTVYNIYKKLRKNE